MPRRRHIFQQSARRSIRRRGQARPRRRRLPRRRRQAPPPRRKRAASRRALRADRVRSDVSRALDDAFERDRAAAIGFPRGLFPSSVDVERARRLTVGHFFINVSMSHEAWMSPHSDRTESNPTRRRRQSSVGSRARASRYVVASEDARDRDVALVADAREERRGSLTARAVREPRRSSRDEDEVEVEVEVEGGEGRARERNRNRATSTGTEKNSVGVQRRLARRLWTRREGGWGRRRRRRRVGTDVDEATRRTG